MEGYVDDMLVETMTFEQHILDLKEVLSMFGHHSMKLNPFICVFIIKGGKVWRFIRRLTTFNQFISRSRKHTLPFFKTLRNISNFEWTLDCQKVFEEIQISLMIAHSKSQ